MGRSAVKFKVVGENKTHSEEAEDKEEQMKKDPTKKFAKRAELHSVQGIMLINVVNRMQAGCTIGTESTTTAINIEFI